MAVPTGTASLADVQAEHGGSHPIKLSEYYGVDSGVPTSGAISIDDLRGTSANKEPIWTAGTSASVINLGGTATARCRLESTGVIDLVNGTDGDWLPSGEAASDYEAKWQKLSGSTVSSTWSENVYASLDVDREVSVSDSSLNGADESAEVRITIRHKSDTSLSVVKDVSLTASYENM